MFGGETICGWIGKTEQMVQKEVVREQEHQYISNGHYVGLLTLYNQYMTEASVSSFVHSDSVWHTQRLAYRRDRLSNLCHLVQRSASLVPNPGPSSPP